MRDETQREVASDAVFICHTLLHVYIALLKKFNSHQKADIILVDTIPDVDKLAKRLRTEPLFEAVIVVKKSDEFVDTRSYHLNYFYVHLMKHRLNKRFSFLCSYDEVSIFNDYTEMGAYLNLVGIPYHLVEDGCDCYKKNNQHKVRGKARIAKTLLNKLFGVPAGLGDGRQIVDIEVNDVSDMRTKLNYPLIEVPRRELMKSVSGKQVEALLRIFDAESLASIEEGSNIILTEPLWEIDATRRFDDVARFYGDIARSLGGKACYIKPHPRDDTDYRAYFPTDKIIDKNIPIELLNYLGVGRFSIAVTYSSTSIGLLEAFDTRLAVDPASAGGDVEWLSFDGGENRSNANLVAADVKVPVLLTSQKG